jgi:hypothetical protein
MMIGATTFKWISQFVMTGGFLMLLCEVRFEHRAALIGDWRPWLPIIFCTVMLALIPLCAFLWHRGGKSVLMATYGAAMMLGLLGLIFHSEGHLLERLLELLSVWTLDLQTSGGLVVEHPPLLAPLAFVGLGFIGLLFCVSLPTNKAVFSSADN